MNGYAISSGFQCEGFSIFDTLIARDLKRLQN